MFRQWHRYFCLLFAKFTARIRSTDEKSRKIWKICSLAKNMCKDAAKEGALAKEFRAVQKPHLLRDSRKDA